MQALTRWARLSRFIIYAVFSVAIQHSDAALVSDIGADAGAEAMASGPGLVVSHPARPIAQPARMAKRTKVLLGRMGGIPDARIAPRL
jgi:hypothetical protein